VKLLLEWDQKARLDVCLEAGATVVSLFWGDPSPYVAAIKRAGATLIQTVGSVEEARHAAGADAVLAQGW
jgi:nitronate monooxygenase